MMLLDKLASPTSPFWHPCNPVAVLCFTGLSVAPPEFRVRHGRLHLNIFILITIGGKEQTTTAFQAYKFQVEQQILR